MQFQNTQIQNTNTQNTNTQNTNTQNTNTQNNTNTTNIQQIQKLLKIYPTCTSPECFRCGKNKPTLIPCRQNPALDPPILERIFCVECYIQMLDEQKSITPENEKMRCPICKDHCGNKKLYQ